jgi:pimeloyl-ACP methyl ester carboxylesterase
MICRVLTCAMLLLTVGVAGAETSHFTGRAVSADGVEIHYETWGAGEPALVFVHGWSCDGSYWAGQVEAFAADRKVVTVDLAGHGQSGDQRTDYTIAAFAADVVAVLEALDLEGAILVGHSMGGPVVVEAALAAPARVRGLIGIDNFQDFELHVPPEQVAAFKSAMAADFAGTVEPWVHSMFPAGSDSVLVEAIAKDMAAAPPAVGLSAMGHTLDWLCGAGAPRLELLEVNLTTISSDMQETKVEQNRELVPGFAVRVMPGVGHFPMRSRPEAFNALLAEAIADFE